MCLPLSKLTNGQDLNSNIQLHKQNNSAVNQLTQLVAAEELQPSSSQAVIEFGLTTNAAV